MKNTAAFLLAGVVALAALAFLIFSNNPSTEDGSAFSAYQAGDEAGAAEAVDGAGSASAASSAKVAKAGAKSKRAPDDEMLKLPHDELNRPGPTGAAAEARRITNRRPRADEEVGKQGDAPTGSLDKADVQKGIQAVRPLVKVCYEDTLEEFPDAAGKVTVEFRIIGEDGKGRVEMTELADDGTTLFDQKLHDCMQKSIAEAEFDTPSGGGEVNVRYPFVFENENDDN